MKGGHLRMSAFLFVAFGHLNFLSRILSWLRITLILLINWIFTFLIFWIWGDGSGGCLSFINTKRQTAPKRNCLPNILSCL